MKTILFMLAIPIFFFAGCGIKGDPLPPAELETVQKTNPESSKVDPATNSSQTENNKKKINK